MAFSSVRTSRCAFGQQATQLPQANGMNNLASGIFNSLASAAEAPVVAAAAADEAKSSSACVRASAHLNFHLALVITGFACANIHAELVLRMFLLCVVTMRWCTSYLLGE